jgi:radical SAM superfamily enzyme YgiQ (UPF0313 family)
MYRSKVYVERPWPEIKAEIDLASDSILDARRIFLADGDALNLPTDKLIQILDYLHDKFPNVERISCYAMPKNLLQKTKDELLHLKTSGLTMLYVGIETGSNLVLKKVTKGATAAGIVKGCLRALDCGFTLSCMIILGLGGKKYSEEHIKDTAKVISEISPHYLGALALILEDGVYQEFMTKFGEKFEHLNDLQLLDELSLLIENLHPKSHLIFRANHASNVYSIGGTLPVERDKLLSLIVELKSNPEMLKPKILRRF